MKKASVAAGACATLGLALGAQCASAAVIRMETTRLVVAPTVSVPLGQPLPPDPGEANTITITQAAAGFVVTDTTAPLTVSSAKCTLNSAPGAIPSQATCAAAKIDHIAVSGGDGNDAITNSTSLPSMLDGGTGDDRVTGGSANDTVIGGEGGSDALNGAGGDTVYTQGRGSDYAHSKRTGQVSCAPGNTVTVYATRTDVVSPACKTVIRPGAPAGEPPASPPAGGTSNPGGASAPVQAPSTLPPPPVSWQVTAQVRILSARVVGRRLRVTGTTTAPTRDRLRLIVSLRLGRRTVTVVRAFHTAGAVGRYTFVVPLGPRLRRARRLAVAVRYLGDSRYLPQTVRRTVVARRSA